MVILFGLIIIFLHTHKNFQMIDKTIQILYLLVVFKYDRYFIFYNNRILYKFIHFVSKFLIEKFN